MTNDELELLGRFVADNSNHRVDEPEPLEVTPTPELMAEHLRRTILPLFIRWREEGEPDRRT